MLQFVVGLIVGASLVGLMVILIAPSRRVRAEPPLPHDVEMQVLLGEIPEDETTPEVSPPEHPAPYSPNDLAELRRLSESRGRRKRS